MGRLFNNLRFQTLITNPDLLAEVIERDGFEVSDNLQTMPSNPERIAKHGKVKACSALAKTTSDLKLLDKLSRDDRRKVRTSLLTNPHIQQHHIEEVARRSLKRDKELGLFTTAAHLLETDRLLPLVQGIIRTQGLPQWNNRRFPMKDARWSGLSLSDPSARALRYELNSRIPTEGADYVQKLLDIGYEDFLFGFQAGSIMAGKDMAWFSTGMMEWIIPLIRPQLVPVFLQTALYSGVSLSLADFEAAANVILADPAGFPDVHEFRCESQTQHAPGVLEGLDELGRGWERYAQCNVYASKKIRMELLNTAWLDELSQLPAPVLPEEWYYEWKLNAEQISYLETQNPEFPWVPAEVVNAFAKKCHNNGWYGRSPDIRINQSLNRLVELVQCVHPDQRRHLTATTMVIYECHRSRTASPWIEYFTDWAKGALEEQPTPEMVSRLLRFAAGFGKEESVFSAILKAHRVDLIPDDIHEIIHGGGIEFEEAVYLVFTKYFGTNTTAWQTGLELRADWDGTLVELAETTCAVEGLVPTEAEGSAPASAET